MEATSLDVSISKSQEACITCLDVALGDEDSGPQIANQVKTPGVFFAPRPLQVHFKISPLCTPHAALSCSASSAITAIQTVVLRV